MIHLSFNSLFKYGYGSGFKVMTYVVFDHYSGKSWVSWYQNVKSILRYTVQQEMVEVAGDWQVTN